MALEHQLTNERLSRKFKTSFDLVNHAIVMAEQLIGSGKIPRVSSHIHNQAFQILTSIDEGKDLKSATDLDVIEQRAKADLLLAQEAARGHEKGHELDR